MQNMTDTMVAFLSFQAVVASGEITPGKGRRHPEILAFLDAPDGKPRATFAYLEDRLVTAFVMFAPADHLKGKRCYQIGYAVDENHRGKGKAKSLCVAALDEFRHALKDDAGFDEFYLEAMIDQKNQASKAVADAIFKSEPELVTDEFADVPAWQYTMLVRT